MNVGPALAVPKTDGDTVMARRLSGAPDSDDGDSTGGDYWSS